MGQCIAQVFARAGRNVRLIGRGADSLSHAMAALERNFAAFVERGLTSGASAEAASTAIAPTTDDDAAAASDFVVETVPAVRATQSEVFGRLDGICPPEVVVASTSGQPYV